MKFRAIKPIREKVYTNTPDNEIRNLLRKHFPRASGLLQTVLLRLEGAMYPPVIVDDNPSVAEDRCPHCGTELAVVDLEQLVRQNKPGT